MTKIDGYTPSLDVARNNYASSRSMSDIGVEPLEAFAEFDRLIRQVRSEAYREGVQAQWGHRPIGNRSPNNPYEGQRP